MSLYHDCFFMAHYFFLPSYFLIGKSACDYDKTKTLLISSYVFITQLQKSKIICYSFSLGTMYSLSFI